MAFLTAVELICTCLVVAAGIVLIAGTFASKNAYDIYEPAGYRDDCVSRCALFGKWDTQYNYGMSCGKKGVCDSAIFAGFASVAIGVIFIAQIVGVLFQERRNAVGGRLSR